MYSSLEKSGVTFRYAEHTPSRGKFLAEDRKLRASIFIDWRIQNGAIDINTHVVNRFANKTMKIYFYVDDVGGSLGDYHLTGVPEGSYHRLEWPTVDEFNVAELVQLRKRKKRKNGKILPGFDLVDGGAACEGRRLCVGLWVVEVAENATLGVRVESKGIVGLDGEEEEYGVAVGRRWPDLKKEMYHTVASVVGGVADTRGGLVMKVRGWARIDKVVGSNP